MILDIDDYPQEWSPSGVIGSAVLGLLIGALIAAVAFMTALEDQIGILSGSIDRYEVHAMDHPPPPSEGTITCECRLVP